MYRSNIASAFYRFYKGLNNHPRSTLQRAHPAVRSFITKGPDDELGSFQFAKDVSIEDLTDQSELDNSQVLATDFLNKDDNVIFQFDSSRPIEAVDWREFEKAFGLDSQDFDEIDLEEIEGLTVTEVVEEEDQFAPTAYNETPSGTSEEELHAPLLMMPTKEEKVINKTASQSENLDKDFEENVETVAKNDNADWSVTRKRSRDSRRVQSDGSERLSTSDRKLRSQQNFPQVIDRKSVEATVTDTLDAPINYKRPGFERRVRCLEAEMERVVVKRLEFNEIWGKSNASVQSVLLSPNLQNLTIFYETEDQSRIKKLKKVAKDLRSTIASSVPLKYVPSVFLEYSTKSTFGNNSNELDDLFRKIAEERAINADLSNSTPTKVL